MCDDFISGLVCIPLGAAAHVVQKASGRVHEGVERQRAKMAERVFNPGGDITEKIFEPGTETSQVKKK